MPVAMRYVLIIDMITDYVMCVTIIRYNERSGMHAVYWQAVSCNFHINL